MKKTMSVILALILVFSLASVMGASAYALEDNASLTLVVTGGTGDAIGGDGLSFAAAAALKGSYNDNEALLVDAGGFAGDAAAIMTAAGYDLVVPDEALTNWDLASISMGISGVSAGVMFEKNGVRAAFVGIVPMGSQDADEYYSVIQSAVTAARDKGADFVIALGSTEDVGALTEAVTGLDAILTYGTAAVEEIAVDAPAAEETEESEDAEESENAEESEDAGEAKVTVLSVGSEFGSIGLVTLDADGVEARNLDADEYEALGLEESDIIRALEAAFVAGNTPVEEEEPAADGEADDASSTDAGQSEEGEQSEDTEKSEEGEQSEDTEKSEEGEQSEDTEKSEESEQSEDTEKSEESEQSEDAEQSEEGEQSEDAEKSEEGEKSEEDEKSEETAPVEPTPAQDAVPEGDASDTDTEVPETVPQDGAGESTDEVKKYVKGKEDLEIAFDHPVESISIQYSTGPQEFKSDYYTLSSDGKTVKIKADVLNGWGEGNYEFTFNFTDGTDAQKVVVNISGTYTPEPTATPENTPAPTATAAPTSTPAPTATAAPKGRTPATGDNSPIVPLMIVLAVLIAALVVVIVLVVRKNKRAKAQQ